jgi:hypothetical protein
LESSHAFANRRAICLPICNTISIVRRITIIWQRLQRHRVHQCGLDTAGLSSGVVRRDRRIC